MSRKQKLLQRILNNPRNIRFDDFCTLMTYFGFVLMRVRGSHHLYQHPMLEQVMNVQPTNNGLAKAYQVEQFLKLIETHGLRLGEDSDE